MGESLSPRMTLPTQLVLHAMLAEPTQEMYGRQICAETSLSSGTIHPILARLRGLGWVEYRWENIDSRAEGRRPRRYYRLTPGGRSVGP